MSEKPQNAIEHFNGVFHAIDIAYSEAVQDSKNTMVTRGNRNDYD